MPLWNRPHRRDAGPALLHWWLAPHMPQTPAPALQFAPADASPAVVRVAVNAGLVLVALSFVKSLLSVGC